MKKFIRKTFHSSQSSLAGGVGQQVETDQSGNESQSERDAAQDGAAGQERNRPNARVRFDNGHNDRDRRLVLLEEENSRLASALNRVAVENLDLRNQVAHLQNPPPVRGGPPNAQRWREIQKLIDQLIAENDQLLEQKVLSNEYVEEIRSIYSKQIAQLEHEIRRFAEERSQLEESQRSLEMEYDVMLKHIQDLQADNNRRPTQEDHVEQLKQLENLMQQLKNKYQTESATYGSHIQAVEEDRNQLAITFSELKAENEAFYKEIEFVRQAAKNAESKLDENVDNLSRANSRIIELEATLADLLKTCEEKSRQKSRLEKMEIALRETIAKLRAQNSLLLKKVEYFTEKVDMAGNISDRS